MSFELPKGWTDQRGSRGINGNGHYLITASNVVGDWAIFYGPFKEPEDIHLTMMLRFEWLSAHRTGLSDDCEYTLNTMKRELDLGNFNPDGWFEEGSMPVDPADTMRHIDAFGRF